MFNFLSQIKNAAHFKHVLQVICGFNSACDGEVDLDVVPHYGSDGKIKGETSLANAFEYGVGLCAGLNVWKLQAIVRYNWNFGALGSLDDFKNIGLGDLKTENSTYGGVTCTVAFFF